MSSSSKEFEKLYVPPHESIATSGQMSDILSIRSLGDKFSLLRTSQSKSIMNDHPIEFHTMRNISIILEDCLKCVHQLQDEPRSYFAEYSFERCLTKGYAYLLQFKKMLFNIQFIKEKGKI